MRRACVVAASCLISTVAACGTHRAPQPVVAASKPQPAVAGRGGGPLSLVGAVDAIASERCAHEQRCERIGAGRQFVDTASCEQAVAIDTRERLSTAVCESGFVEASTLLECLAAIRAGGCATEVGRVCEPSTMCSP